MCYRTEGGGSRYRSQREVIVSRDFKAWFPVSVIVPQGARDEATVLRLLSYQTRGWDVHELPYRTPGEVNVPQGVALSYSTVSYRTLVLT